MPTGARSGSVPDAGARSDASARVSGRRLEVLRLLRTAGVALSIVELADGLDMHPNTVRFHLGALVDGGLVQRQDSAPRAAGRPPLLFAPVRGMDPGGPRRYSLLSGVLAQALDGAPDVRERALAAGREWGREVAVPLAGVSPDDPTAAVDRLVTMLEELDFDPVLMAGAGGAEGADPSDGAGGADDRMGAAAHGATGAARAIGLRRCPFLEVARAHSPVVCPVHLGLMQGVMEAWAAPVTVDRLDPFVEPDLCLAHLAPAGAGSPLPEP